jgi:dihydrofolate reductase
MGHTVVMGRRTWDSLPARFRPLPGRRNVVLTRNRGLDAPGAEVVGSIDDAIDDQTWVIGGSEIYHLALPAATRCEVT